MEVKVFDTFGDAIDYLSEELSTCGITEKELDEIQIQVASMDEEDGLEGFIFFLSVNEVAEEIVPNTTMAKVAIRNLTKHDLHSIEEMGVYGEGDSDFDFSFDDEDAGEEVSTKRPSHKKSGRKAN